MSANEPGVLFQPGEMPVGPRPKDRDPRVVKAVIDRLIPKVERWMGDDWREAERVEVVEQLTKACQEDWTGDGYQIARTLDRNYHWECDSELVDILEMYASYCSDIHDQLIRQWVADSGVKPKLALGAEVTMALPIKGVATGKIVKINTERGEYGVTCPSLGQAWDEKSQLGSCYIVAWEWLENEVAGATRQERLDPDVGKKWMKLFHISDVLSVTTGRLVSSRHMDGIYEILNFLTGDDLFTHQLPRAMDECKPWLRVTFPELMADSPGMPERLADLDSRIKVALQDRQHIAAAVGDWVEHLRLSLSLPEMLPVYELGSEMHTRIDPIKEARSMIGDGRVLVVDTAEPGASITCPRCKAVSHNPNDVEQRYCGACKHFYADVCAGCRHPFEDHRPVCVHYFLESGRVDPICNCREFKDAA